MCSPDSARDESGANTAPSVNEFDRPAVGAAPVQGDPDAALDALFVRQDNRTHAVNVRLSLPVLGRRVYLVVLGGAELRHTQRRARERGRYPLLTPGNVAFLGGVVAVLYAVALVILVGLDGILGG